MGRLVAGSPLGRTAAATPTPPSSVASQSPVGTRSTGVDSAVPTEPSDTAAAR